MGSHSRILPEIGQNQFNYNDVCDRCNDFRIYEHTGRSLDNQSTNPERPMFKFLKRLSHRPHDTLRNPTEEQSFSMDTSERDEQQARTQMNQNRPRPGFNQQRNKTTAARILCCLSNRDPDDSLRTDNTRRKSPPELHREYEDRIEQFSDDISHRLDFSMPPTHPQSRREPSKISFHREEDFSNGRTAEILYSADSRSSSRQTSDTEFFDARENFSDSDSDSENSSQKSLTLRRNSSILKRCRCITCTSTVQELGCPINYRIAEVCDARDRQKPRVRVNSDVRVAKYDIRSGNVMEEWIEEINLSEEVIPIGYLRNTDMDEEANLRRSRARRKLRNLFSADKRIRDEDFEDLSHDESLDYDGMEDFSQIDDLGSADELEPRTTRNPGTR